MLWVQIPTPYTGWTFFTLISCKNCIVCLKRPKINVKDAGVGSFFLKKEVEDWPPPASKTLNGCKSDDDDDDDDDE